MPTSGTSLVGFLPQQEAINLLRNSCVVSDPSDAALSIEWAIAAARLGAPTPNAGNPDIQPIPAGGLVHIAKLVHEPWVMSALQGSLAGAAFQMVELKPLLAFQFNVDLARSSHHNGGASSQPTVDELFNMCLPLTPIIENVRPYAQQNSVMIHSKGLNFQAVESGILQKAEGTFVGLRVGVSLPLMHVVRHNGRCFLHNGFHRAVGLARRGVTHAPCIFRDVLDYGAVGIRPGMTFEPPLLESANPPTVAHLADGRANDVQMKVFTRTLHISWADHITTDD